MKAEFYTVENIHSSEITEKKSRFIAHLAGVSTREDAENFFRSVRSRYKDARHNVPAFRIGIENIDEWANDDGEPSGTAGKPILDILRNAGLTNVAIIVTRYFGGILLGTGGLVRAYGAVASQLVAETPHVKKSLHRRLLIDTEYKNLGKVKRFLEEHAIYSNMVCLQNVVFTYDVAIDKLEFVEREIMELCCGKVTIFEGEDIFVTIQSGVKE